jgi:hypothetical protein
MDVAFRFDSRFAIFSLHVILFIFPFFFFRVNQKPTTGVGIRNAFSLPPRASALATVDVCQSNGNILKAINHDHDVATQQQQQQQQ